MTNIAILASGSGTNAEAIMKHFSASETIHVALVASNNPGAYVLERAALFGVPTIAFTREDMRNPDGDFARALDSIDFVVLAGFLWLIPSYITSRFVGRIVNIHPALLPKYGGRGMYGDNVHRAVIAAAESESGITIHFVNEHYDSGDIIHQARCEVRPDDTPETLAARIHTLEHRDFPCIIEQTILKAQ